MKIEIDQLETEVKIKIVRDDLQEFPILVGRHFTEPPHIIIVKD